MYIFSMIAPRSSLLESETHTGFLLERYPVHMKII